MTDKKLMKIIGIIMLMIGLFIFISNIRVGGFSYFRLGWGGWILLLMGIDFIALVIKPNKIFGIIMAILAIVFVISIITNMHVYMTSMSFIKWLFIALFMFGGIGLTVKGTFK